MHAPADWPLMLAGVGLFIVAMVWTLVIAGVESDWPFERRDEE